MYVKIGISQIGKVIYQENINLPLIQKVFIMFFRNIQTHDIYRV